GIAFGGDADFAAPGVEPVLARRHLVRVTAVNAVIAQQVRVGFDGAEIVDPDHLDLPAWMLHRRSEDQPSDAAKAVDRNPSRHGSSSRSSVQIYRSERAASATFSGVMPKCG